MVARPPAPVKRGILRRLALLLPASGLVGAGCWGLVGLGLLTPEPASAGSPATLVVPVATVRSSSGTVFVALYEEGSWLIPGRFRSYRKVPARSGTVGARFEKLPPGRYAVAVFHDENGNGRIDTNFLGLPSEGYGFSRITPFRKPSFEETAFELTDKARVPVRLKY